MKLIAVLISFSSLISWSQDYGTDIANLFKQFSNLDEYSIRAEVSVKGDDSYSFKATVKSSAKYGNITKVDVSEMLVNDKIAIAIDHEDKTIRIDEGDFKVKSKGEENLGFDEFEKVINESAEVTFLGETEVYKTYEFKGKGDILKTVVKINKSTGFFHEIEVFYESDDISISSYKVKYTSFNKSPGFKKTDFDEKQIVKKDSKGKWVGVGKYVGYTIIE